MMKLVKNLLSKFIRKNKEEFKHNDKPIYYYKIDYNYLVKEYAIPEEYLPFFMKDLVLCYYNEELQREEFYKYKLEKIKNYYPVIEKPEIPLPGKYMMESLIRFEM